MISSPADVKILKQQVATNHLGFHILPASQYDTGAMSIMSITVKNVILGHNAIVDVQHLTT